MTTTTTVRETMTPDPVTLPHSATIRDAAQAMRDGDIGDVIVVENGRVFGIVTDRDLVVRAIAEGLDPEETSLEQICTPQPITVSPDDTTDAAVELMRREAIRRLPVADDGAPIGIISLGDLALERDPTSVLGDISAAPANR